MPRSLCLLALFLLADARSAAATERATLLQAALTAEARLETPRALELFFAAGQTSPTDSFVLQKIAQQYSDLIVDFPDPAKKKRLAETALSYAQRAVALDPQNAVNVLSLAVCHGELAPYADNRSKIEYSRLVKEEAERAIALDPNYAWAHHLLGRWHCEVANLGGATKWFAHAIYGGLPPASAGEGVKELTRAVELEPDELAHRLELGFAYLAVQQQGKARLAFATGLAMPSRRKHDNVAKERAQAALDHLFARSSGE